MALNIADFNRQLACTGASLQVRYMNTRQQANQSRFARDGAVAYNIPNEVVADLWGYFAAENEQPFNASAVAEGYIGHQLPDEVVDKINQQNTYYGTPNVKVQNALSSYVKYLSRSIREQISYDFRVINIRAWMTKPNANYGPSAWHSDGSDEFFMPKLMLYLKPPSIDNGTIEFYTRDGRRLLLRTAEPSAILLDSSTLLHRGRSSEHTTRPMIEITLAPDFTTERFLAFPGQNARFAVAHVEELGRNVQNAPGRTLIEEASSDNVDPLAEGDSFENAADDGFVPAVANHAQYLNIGGGKYFHHPGWLNLDEFPPEGAVPFKLSDHQPFPIPSCTMQMVYSSHCLEHLDTSSVVHCLNEAARVLRQGGPLIVKLPDFDAGLAAYRAHDQSYFENQWGLESIVESWPSRGV